MTNEKLERVIGIGAAILGFGIMAGAAFVEAMNKRDREAEKRHNLRRAERLLNGWSSGPELVKQIDIIEARRDLECADYAYHQAKSAYDKLVSKDAQPIKPEPATKVETVDADDKVENGLA